MPAKKQPPETEHDFPRGVARPAVRALASIGVTRLDQLTKVTEAELIELHGMGPTALAALRAALAVRGKSFRKSAKR